MSALSVKKWLCVMLCVCLLLSLATPFALSEELPAVNAASETAAQPAPTVTSEPTAEPTSEPTAEPAAEPATEPAAEPAPTVTAEPAPTVTAEPAPTVTSEPAAEPTAGPTAEPTAEPEKTIVGFEPATYVLTAEYGAALEELGLPGAVTANLSDGTSADVAVVWSCASYNPQHGQAEPVSYTFAAALVEDTYACQAALPTAVVTVAAAPAVPMLFAGNGGASTLATYGDPFTLEIQRIGGNYSFYPGETIVVKLTNFALQEGHTLESVTVWTDVKGSSEEKTLENPQEDATVEFVVPEDAAEERLLRVYATAEIVDVSGDPVEGYPEQVKSPYFFSISHQTEVAIDVTVVPIGILPDKAKIVINKVYCVDSSEKMYASDVIYTYEWAGTDAPGSRSNETITHDSTLPCTYTLHIDDERRYKLVDDYTYTLQNVEKSEAPLRLSVTPDGSEKLEPLTITAQPTNTLKSGHTIKEVQAICTYRNDGTEHPVTLKGDAQNGFSAEFTPTANGIWDISISYTVQDAEGADVSAYYDAPSSKSVTMGPKVIDISLDFYDSEQVGEYGDENPFFVTYQCNQVESLEGLITIRETAGKPGVVTYDGNTVTFTATGVGTYSLISELVEGAKDKGYIHTVQETCRFEIQPGSAQAQVKHINSGKDASDCYQVATANVQVEGAGPEYTLVIPASVTLDGDGKASLPLSCTQIQNAVSVRVTVDSENDFTLEDGENAIAYTLSGESGQIHDGGVAATFTATGSADLSLAVTQGADPAPGTYTDTLTFTASAE